MDLNLNLNNSSNIFFNGNDITMANIFPKKSTLQLLMEISSEMDSLSSHLEQVLPNPIKYNIDYKITNAINNIPTYTPPTNLDQEDLEIKKLINKANEMTNNSILNKKSEINNSINNEVKTYEDKGCQSEDEFENSYRNIQNENEKTQKDYYNNNFGNGRFPYDPYKHLDYYNDLRNNNGNNVNNFEGRVRRYDEFYNTFRRNPVIYSQPESFDNNYQNYNTNREMPLPFQRYRPGSINQAMDILLDKK